MVRATKKAQALRISPEGELVFRGDPTENNTSQIQLFNPLQESIAFKILTNVPHLLFVRPTCHIIPPQGSCTVNVMSQASNNNSLDFFKHHKLLIQAVNAPTSCLESVDQIITRNKEDVMDTKLTCVFQVSYTSELTFPLETEEETVSHKTEAIPKQKTPNRFNCYAIIGAILVCVLACLAYNFHFRPVGNGSENYVGMMRGGYDGRDDDGVEDGMLGLKEKLIGKEMDDDVSHVIEDTIEDTLVDTLQDEMDDAVDILETSDDILDEIADDATGDEDDEAADDGTNGVDDDVADDGDDDVADDRDDDGDDEEADDGLEDVYDDAIKNLEEEMQKIGEKIRSQKK